MLPGQSLGKRARRIELRGRETSEKIFVIVKEVKTWRGEACSRTSSGIESTG